MTTGFSATDEAEKKANEVLEDERGQSVAKRKHHAAPPVGAVLEGVAVRSALPPEAKDLQITQVTCDSRKVQPGALFVAIQGIATNGNLFAKDCRRTRRIADSECRSYASRLVEQRRLVTSGGTAQSPRNYCRELFWPPRRRTETGWYYRYQRKPTTSSSVDSIVRASGAKTGLFGTIAYHTPLRAYPAPNTTPESVDLQAFFAEVRDAEGTHVVLEASSHALALDRLWGCHFRRGCFLQI